MRLEAGSRLGPYVISSALGAGGMGEVYRAHDDRLGRDVAIKVLPPSFAGDADRLLRFEQEARAAAALNHPNILAVYDIGRDDRGPYIVSELLDGETLAESLTRGALPAREALDRAAQIARGLAAAHDKGIVHRDLKPANVLVTADGRAKILDFGLAKLAAPEPALAGGTSLATAAPSTTPGMVMGTVGYMSPEQVRGGAADHRTDIFAFGVLLYEMLTGAPPFARETPAETMTAILKEEPPLLAERNARLPLALQRIVNRCLEKNPPARFQSASDLAFALDNAAAESSTTHVAAAAAPPPRRISPAWLVAAAIVLAGAGAAWLMTRARPEPPLVRFWIAPPDGWQLDISGPTDLPIAMSPDGRAVLFRASTAGRRMLFLRTLDSLEPRPLEGTQDAVPYFWSPDGRAVGFVAGGRLNRIDLASGSITVVATLTEMAFGGSWGAHGDILLGSAQGLLRVPATGGTPTVALAIDGNHALYNLPIFLPDGEHFVFVAVVGDVIRAGATRQLWGGRLGSTERTLLLDGNQFGMPVTADETRLLFMRGQSLVAQPYAVDPMALTGAAATLVDRVKLMADRPYGFVAASATGLLGYIPEASTAVHQLRWFDREGHQLATLGEPANYTNIELSADDSRAALAVLDPIKRTRDIWLFDLARSVRTRFTFEAGEERSAIWSPDGARVLYNSQRKGTERELFAKPANGAGAEETVLADGKSKDALSWSSDGRFVLYRVSGTAGNEIWAVPMDGARKPFPVVTTGNALQGRFSPDGRWIAHIASESGRTEVFVVAFPGPGGKWQVSNAGGSFPRWRADGKELFYLSADGSIVAVPVDIVAGTFTPGMPQTLFHAEVPRDAGYQYTVSRDGQRFLVNTTTGPASTISVITDWRRLNP